MEEGEGEEGGEAEGMTFSHLLKQYSCNQERETIVWLLS